MQGRILTRRQLAAGSIGADMLRRREPTATPALSRVLPKFGLVFTLATDRYDSQRLTLNLCVRGERFWRGLC